MFLPANNRFLAIGEYVSYPAANVDGHTFNVYMIYKGLTVTAPETSVCAVASNMPK